MELWPGRRSSCGGGGPSDETRATGWRCVGVASWELEAEGDGDREPAVELLKPGRSLEAELRRLPTGRSFPVIKDEDCATGGCSELAASWRLSAM